MSGGLEAVLRSHLTCSCPSLLDQGEDAHVAAAVTAWIEERLGSEETHEAVWEAVAKVRDAYPRRPDDAGSADVTTAALTAVRDALGVPVRPAGGEVAPGEAGDGKGAQIGAEGIEGER